jgi:hypothetical protein
VIYNHQICTQDTETMILWKWKWDMKKITWNLPCSVILPCSVTQRVIPACCLKMSDSKHTATWLYITDKWRNQLINIQRSTNTIHQTITSTLVLHLSNYTTQQATIWHQTCSKCYNKHAIQLTMMWYCQTVTDILYNSYIHHGL